MRRRGEIRGAAEADKDMLRRRRAAVPHRSPAGPRKIVPGAALEDKIVLVPRRRSPLEEIADHVVKTVGTLPVRKAVDRCRGTKPLAAVEVVGRPLIAPRKDAAVSPARRLLPFRFCG